MLHRFVRYSHSAVIKASKTNVTNSLTHSLTETTSNTTSSLSSLLTPPSKAKANPSSPSILDPSEALKYVPYLKDKESGDKDLEKTAVETMNTIQRRRRLYTANISPPPEEARLIPLPNSYENTPLNGKLIKVAIIGPANAGKSTLLNQILRQKVSIVSSKAQTTRTQVLGIKTEGNVQMIFLDTPGVPVSERDAKSVHSEIKGAWQQSMNEADCIIALMDVLKCPSPVDHVILSRLTPFTGRIPILVVFNKMDRVRDVKKCEQVIALLREKHPNVVEQVRFMSALRSQGVTDLVTTIKDYAKPGKWLFPPEIHSTLSKVTMIEEIVREKVYRRLNAETPYRVRPVLNGWKEHENGILELHLTLHHKEQRHTPIIKGAKGEALEYVRYCSEQDLCQLFNRNRIDMHLRVLHSPDLFSRDLVW